MLSKERCERGCGRGGFVASKPNAAGNTCRIVKAFNTACGESDRPQPASTVPFDSQKKNKADFRPPRPIAAYPLRLHALLRTPPSRMAVSAM